MLSPKDSERGRLLQRFVRARIVNLVGIDVGLYDFDRHNAIYFFIVSPDEDVYLRYGGRDAASADTYLDLDSFVLALEAGLEQHALWQAGELPARPRRPAPLFPREMERLKTIEMDRGRCIECHMVGDYQAVDKEIAGTLDKRRDMFRTPDIRDIGIHLDIPKGLVVGRSTGRAEAAGLEPGDRIVAVAGTDVLAHGDLLHAYDQHDRTATKLDLTVEREGAGRVDLEVGLPPLWWVSDLGYRYWSIDPVTYLSASPLSAGRKRGLDLRPDGFACEVTRVNPRATVLELHEIKAGDVIYAVDGVEADPPIDDCLLYLRLNVTAGSETTLGVVRDGTRRDMTARTQRQLYRKLTPTPSGP